MTLTRGAAAFRRRTRCDSEHSAAPPKCQGRKRRVREGMGGGRNARFSEEEEEKILERDAYARANGIDEPWKGQAKALFPNRKDILAKGRRKADKIVSARAKELRRRERDRAKQAKQWDGQAAELGYANAQALWAHERRTKPPWEQTTLTTSEFRGVHFHAGSGKWRSQITKNGTTYNLGAFDDEEDASGAYEAAADADEVAISTSGTDRRRCRADLKERKLEERRAKVRRK